MLEKFALTWYIPGPVKFIGTVKVTGDVLLFSKSWQVLLFSLTPVELTKGTGLQNVVLGYTKHQQSVIGKLPMCASTDHH